MSRPTLKTIVTLSLALIALAALWLVVGAPGPTAY
jgi:hypothetical protein